MSSGTALADMYNGLSYVEMCFCLRHSVHVHKSCCALLYAPCCAVTAVVDSFKSKVHVPSACTYLASCGPKATIPLALQGVEYLVESRDLKKTNTMARHKRKPPQIITERPLDATTRKFLEKRDGVKNINWATQEKMDAIVAKKRKAEEEELYNSSDLRRKQQRLDVEEAARMPMLRG